MFASHPFTICYFSLSHYLSIHALPPSLPPSLPQGTHDELLQKEEGDYKKMWEMQQKGNGRQDWGEGWREEGEEGGDEEEDGKEGGGGRKGVQQEQQQEQQQGGSENGGFISSLGGL